MTLANKITIARMCSVPVVLWAIYQGRYFLALGVFAVAAVSDGVDGYIARKYKQQTVLGSILDPLADKLLLTLTFIILTASPKTLVRHHAWLTVLVAYRDIIILLGCGVVKWFCPTMHFRPIISSKLTTFFQIVTVLMVVLANVLASMAIGVRWAGPPILVLSIVTGLFCMISVLGYFGDGIWYLQTEGEEGTSSEAAL